KRASSSLPFKIRLVDDRAHLLSDRYLNRIGGNADVYPAIAWPYTSSIHAESKNCARRKVWNRGEGNRIARYNPLAIARCGKRSDLGWEVGGDNNITVCFGTLVDNRDAIAGDVTNADWVFCITDVEIESWTPSPTCCEFSTTCASLAVCNRNAVSEAAWCA